MKKADARRALAACVLFGAVASVMAGCPGGGTGSRPLPPTIFSPSATTLAGSLTLNQAANVTVSATVVDPSGTITSVTADLTQIGGSSVVPLTLSTVVDIWSTTITVIPPAAGTWQVPITAVSSTGLSGQATATINVAGTSGNTPPELSNPLVTGPLVANSTSSIIVSVTAIDVDGTIQSVVADLSQIGGLPAVPLLQSGQNSTLWAFSGLVTPPTAGTLTVTLLTADNLGGTVTATATVVVNPPVP